ncbi:unnamed protein product (mitochondrion) [Plasmodiophora brassicae]|uniref:Phosphofurin acidic cluster sorting protein 1/2 C-terminal domain-containing protein n=2 Tax=Plasmodiophora brassicae TaxID=37360 RepID=A0A3P3YMJ1_PLABS|nr:unnamed protein product [Plasmodiophora brassicae]
MMSTPHDTAAGATPPVMSARLISASQGAAPAGKALRGPFGGPKRPRVPRVCHVRVHQLETLRPLQKSARFITISARIRGQKPKHMLTSAALPSAPDDSAALPLPLDLWFSISYLHRLKGEPSVVQLSLHKCKADGRNPSLLGSLDLPLDQILQCPLRVANVSLEHTRMNARPVPIARLLVDVWTSPGASDAPPDMPPPAPAAFDDATAAHAVDSAPDEDDDLTSPSAISDVASDSDEDSFNRDLRTSTVPAAQRQQQQQQQQAIPNPLLKLRPALYSKMRIVKQSGTRFFDRIRALRRNKPMSSSDEDGDDELQVRDMQTIGPAYPQPSEDAASVHAAPAPHEDDDLHAVAYVDVSTQMENLGASIVDGAGWPQTIILVDRNARPARQILDWAQRTSRSSVLATHRLLFFGDCSEADFVFSGITQLYRQHCPGTTLAFRIGIAGDDTSVSMILRPFVQLLSREPRTWNDLRFHVIPLNNGQSPHDHVAAERIARHDAQFRSLFFSALWENALDGHSSLLEPVGKQIEEAVQRYMLGADEAFRLPIAEAMLEIEDMDDPEMDGVERVSFPMIRDFAVLDIADDVEQMPAPAPRSGSQPPPGASTGASPPSPEHHVSHFGNISFFPTARRKQPVIEYWTMSDKKAPSKKHTYKSGFAAVRVYRLLGDVVDADLVDSASANVEPAGAQEFPGSADEKAVEDGVDLVNDVEQLLMVVRPLPKDKNKFLQRLGAYSPKRSMVGALEKDLREPVCKFVCLAPTDSHISACVDGIVIPNVKLASLTPVWPTRTKSFPVAVFRSA